jgi:hypothetical protein
MRIVGGCSEGVRGGLGNGFVSFLGGRRGMRSFERDIKRSFDKVVQNIQEFGKGKRKGGGGGGAGGTDINFYRKTNVIKVIDY